VNGVAEDYASTPQPVDLNSWLWGIFARSVRDNMMAEFVVQALRIGGMVIALICGVAVGAVKLLAIHLGIEGPLNLIIIAVAPALAYMWLESASAMKTVADAFGRGRLIPSATAGEA
jgi:hypothetical protein